MQQCIARREVQGQAAGPEQEGGGGAGRRSHSKPGQLSNPRFVAWPLELGLGTHNPHFVVWPLELGLGTHNPRFPVHNPVLTERERREPLPHNPLWLHNLNPNPILTARERREPLPHNRNQRLKKPRKGSNPMNLEHSLRRRYGPHLHRRTMMMRMLRVLMGMYVPFVAPSLTLKRCPCVTSVNCNIVRIALTHTHTHM